jgi:phage gp29-like protein
MFDANPNRTMRELLQDWLEWWIPRTSKKKMYNFRGEPGFAANTMDVDKLRGTLAAAEVGDTRDLFALYRDVMVSDSHIQTEFSKRKLAVLGDPTSVQPADKTKPEDVQAAEAIQDMIDWNRENFIHACNHWLDGHLWPVALVEKVFKPSTRPGLRFQLDRLVPVPHIDLDYTSGWLQLWGLDPATGYINGTREAPDPNRYVVHRGHLLQQADYWGGPFRSLLFWWLMSAMDRDWWARFLDRYGAPFIVGKFDPADDAARSILSRAFQAATKIFGLVVSKSTEIELIQAASGQTGDAFKSFFDLCNDQKSILILGQASSAKQAEGGLSNSGNKQHEGVRQDIRQYDQMILSLTIQQQLFRQYLDINGFTGATPRLIWGGVSTEEQTALGDLMLKFAQAGLEPTDDGISTLSERVAFPLQRKAVPAPMPMMSAAPWVLTAGDRLVLAGHASVDRVAANGAADLAQAFRGSLAPVRRIIAESRSAVECETRLREFYADWRPDKLAGLIEEALQAYAANGAASRGA